MTCLGSNLVWIRSILIHFCCINLVTILVNWIFATWWSNVLLKLEKLSDSSHRSGSFRFQGVPWVLVLSIGLVFSFSPLSRIPFFLLLFFTTNGRENRISKKREKTQIRGTSRKRESRSSWNKKIDQNQILVWSKMGNRIIFLLHTLMEMKMAMGELSQPFTDQKNPAVASKCQRMVLKRANDQWESTHIPSSCSIVNDPEEDAVKVCKEVK